MRVTDGGYSGQMYNNRELRQFASKIALVLPGIMRQANADAIIVQGKSGIALAFATLMLIDFPIIVVRKRNESTHGSPIEGTEGVDVQRYLILDDFISSGNTVRRIVEQLRENSIYTSNGSAECVGVVEYKAGCDEIHTGSSVLRTTEYGDHIEDAPYITRYKLDCHNTAPGYSYAGL